MNYETKVFKALDDQANPIERHFGLLSRFYVNGIERPIDGKVISVSDKYVVLEHRDRRITTIRVDDIRTIRELSGA